VVAGRRRRGHRHGGLLLAADRGLLSRFCCRYLYLPPRSRPTTQISTGIWVNPVGWMCLQMLRTHPETGQTAAARLKALKESCRNIQWLSLNMLDCQNGRVIDQYGTVTFEARWRDRDRREGVLRECSRFGRGESGEWLYLEALSLGDELTG